MIELKTSYSDTRVPYVSYDDLEKYAQQVVADFAPELLRRPGAIDVDLFMQYYLGLNVVYRKLCYGQRSLGFTAFNDGEVAVIDENTGETEPMPVTKGTVIIDSSLNSGRDEPRRRFTVMHEGCHWLLHRETFAEGNPYGPSGSNGNLFLAAREGTIEYRQSQKIRYDIDCMERQADFLASTMLMPLISMRIAYKTYFRLCSESPRRIVRGSSPNDDFHARNVTEFVANTFKVSKQAASIRMEKLNTLMDGGCKYA